MVVASSVLLAVAAAAVLDAVDVALTFSGFCAPHGLSWRHDDEHALSPLQAATHWLPHSWQTKYGSVSEYSVTFGRLWSPHRQP